MTQTLYHSKWSPFYLAIIFSVSLIGCQAAHQVGITKTGAPKYDKLLIDYELRNSTGALAMRDFSPERSPLEESVIQQAEAVEETSKSHSSHLESTPHFDSSQWSHAMLNIQYPHPNGSTTLVRATLRLSQAEGLLLQSTSNHKETWSEIIREGWGTIRNPFSEEIKSVQKKKLQPRLTQRSETDDEIWVYDFPKSQLDLMLTDLAGSGFFHSQHRPNGNASLAVTINSGKVSKDWSAEPRLDDVILLVYRKGWLGGFAKNRTFRSDAVEAVVQVGFEE